MEKKKIFQQMDIESHTLQQYFTEKQIISLSLKYKTMNLDKEIQENLFMTLGQAQYLNCNVEIPSTWQRWAGEVFQRLGTLPAPAEDPRSVPSIHARQLTVPGTPAAGDPTLSSPQLQLTGTAHTWVHTSTHNLKNNNKKKNFLNSQDQTGKMTRPNKWSSLFEANMAERIRKVVCISVFPY